MKKQLEITMNNILNKMKGLKKQKDNLLMKEIINHPVAKKNIEIKIHYLNGLALMMNVDEEISDEEKVFFLSLMQDFELEKSIIDNFFDFAKEPENEQIVELLEEIKKDDFIKFAFMIDNYRIAYKDGKFSDEEKELIELFFEMLEFDKEEIDKINASFKEIDLPVDYEVEFHQFDIKAVINHPMIKKNPELKMIYLIPLASIMNFNSNIAKKVFFRSLIETFEINKWLIDNLAMIEENEQTIDSIKDIEIEDLLIDFAKTEEIEHIKECLEELRKDDFIKFAFMIDSYRISHKDGKFNNKEKEMIELFFEMLEFSQKDFIYFAEIITKKNGRIDYFVEFKKYNERN